MNAKLAITAQVQQHVATQRGAILAYVHQDIPNLVNMAVQVSFISFIISDFLSPTYEVQCRLACLHHFSLHNIFLLFRECSTFIRRKPNKTLKQLPSNKTVISKDEPSLI